MTNQLDRIIEGLIMFRGIKPKDVRAHTSELEYSVAAEHDVIYAGPSPDTLSEGQVLYLRELGWYADESLDCFQFFT